VWDKGAPDLAVEVLSPSDTAEPITLEEKLGRYGSVGVRELVFFDVDAPEGARLRAWDRLEDVLVERDVVDERTPCLTLGGLFLLAPAEDRAVALRLSRDAEGLDLVPLASELKDAERAQKEAARAEGGGARRRRRRSQSSRVCAPSSRAALDDTVGPFAAAGATRTGRDRPRHATAEEGGEMCPEAATHLDAIRQGSGPL
jgi:hypothetical protein